MFENFHYMFLISMFLLVSLGPAQAPVNSTGAREDIAQEVAEGANGSRQEDRRGNAGQEDGAKDKGEGQEHGAEGKEKNVLFAIPQNQKFVSPT